MCYGINDYAIFRGIGWKDLWKMVFFSLSLIVNKIVLNALESAKLKGMDQWSIQIFLPIKKLTFVDFFPMQL